MTLSPATKRYLIIGSTVYIIELLIIYVALRAGSTNIEAVSLSFWLGLAISFLLQKFITFQDNRLEKRVVGQQILLYGLLVLVNWAFTILFTHLFSSKLSTAVCRTVALLITTCWNFYLYRTRIFRQFIVD